VPLHLELRQFPHSARAFNLEPPEIAGLLAAWVTGTPVEWGEHEWEPRKAKLTVLEGPELPPSEIGMGRGWPAAQRAGRDVTSQLLAGARAPAAEDRRADVLALCGPDPRTFEELLEQTGARGPERAALERAVWALVVAGELRLLRRPAS
jgi:hypothetical protein